MLLGYGSAAIAIEAKFFADQSIRTGRAIVCSQEEAEPPKEHSNAEYWNEGNEGTRQRTQEMGCTKDDRSTDCLTR